MNKLLLSLLILFVSTFSYTEQISQYKFITLNVVKTGIEDGKIGWKTSKGGGYSGPTAITISKDKKIYIPDRKNRRINIYDSNINFIRTIIEEKAESHFSFKMLINDNGSIFSKVS